MFIRQNSIFVFYISSNFHCFLENLYDLVYHNDNVKTLRKRHSVPQLFVSNTGGTIGHRFQSQRVSQFLT
jgi:hypothetical protein